jgi:alanine dehydrogenase
MDIGIPLERSKAERRLVLTPAAVQRLVGAGHRVYVERAAGAGARFSDEEYRQAGAELCYAPEEVWGRADLLVKVQAPTPDEYGLLREESLLMCFLTPAVIPAAGFHALLDRRVSAIAMELVEDARGNAPILRAMSELAGPMSIHIAAHLLESASDGRGILLGGAPGIPPATVVILGAGVVGTTAARTAVGCGAHVLLLDRDADRLRAAEATLSHRVTTMIADDYHLARAVQFADVLIGAVMIRGGRTPHLVTEAMIRTMKPGSVAIDVSVDQGGCLETSRPTSIHEPTYRWGHVVHYAVPNMPANVARTATRALTLAALPYVLAIAGQGLGPACRADHGLCRGVVTADGACLVPFVADLFGVTACDLAEVLAASEAST